MSHTLPERTGACPISPFWAWQMCSLFIPHPSCTLTAFYSGKGFWEFQLPAVPGETCAPARARTSVAAGDPSSVPRPSDFLGGRCLGSVQSCSTSHQGPRGASEDALLGSPEINFPAQRRNWAELYCIDPPPLPFTAFPDHIWLLELSSTQHFICRGRPLKKFNFCLLPSSHTCKKKKHFREFSNSDITRTLDSTKHSFSVPSVSLRTTTEQWHPARPCGRVYGPLIRWLLLPTAGKFSLREVSVRVAPLINHLPFHLLHCSQPVNSSLRSTNKHTVAG